MKNHYAALLLMLVILSTLFTACDKLGPAPSYTGSSGSSAPSSMKFSYNNTAVSLNSCTALSLSVNNASHVNISGVNVTGGKDGNLNMIIDIITSIDSLRAGQTFQAATDFGQTGVEDLLFTVDTTTYVSQPAAAQGTVVITSVSSTYIKGTFTGTLYGGLDFSATQLIYTVTNGSFIAKRG